MNSFAETSCSVSAVCRESGEAVTHFEVFGAVRFFFAAMSQLSRSHVAPLTSIDETSSVAKFYLNFNVSRGPE